MQQHDNLINGEWRAAASYSANVNPSNLGDVLGQYAQGDAAQVDAAVAAASAAFPAWSTGGTQARSEALEKIGAEILARKEELGTLLAREEGKTKAEGIGEATRAGQIFKFFAGECPAERLEEQRAFAMNDGPLQGLLAQVTPPPGTCRVTGSGAVLPCFLWLVMSEKEVHAYLLARDAIRRIQRVSTLFVPQQNQRAWT